MTLMTTEALIIKIDPIVGFPGALGTSSKIKKYSILQNLI